MKVVNLKGGLGNQLFQWAFAYAISRKYNEIVKFDASSYLSDDLRELEIEKIVGQIELASENEISSVKREQHFVAKLMRKCRTLFLPFHKRNIIEEQSYLYNEKLLLDLSPNAYLDGYWQNEKYFLSFKEALLSKLVFTNKGNEFELYRDKISSTNSISVHVRRGDYIKDKRITNIHGVCSIEYYKNAIKEMSNSISNAHFYIFSNDQAWCKENFDFISNITFVDKTKSVFEDLELMTLCKANIIANSSLSWWGAWISSNENVIAPKKWFNESPIDYSELVPKRWKKLDN